MPFASFWQAIWKRFSSSSKVVVDKGETDGSADLIDAVNVVVTKQARTI